jgi:cell wall-associated NlpC family hydrolase
VSSRRILIVLPAMLILGLFASTAASAQEVNFTDIGSTAQREAVAELAAIDIVRGCATDRYCPEDTLSRAHVAALMDRSLGLSAGADAALSGTDGDTAADASFADTTDSTHRAAIEAVAEAGLMVGCEDGAFCPHAPITRGQLATVFQRAFDLPDAPADARYFVDAGNTHVDAINAITAAGISNGCDLVQFCTDQPLNRGHAAIFVARALDMVERVEIAPFDERKAAYDERVAAEEAAAKAKAEAEAEARAKREAELAPGRKAVEVAMAQVGKPYRWGASGPGSFDCSGLTSFAWRAAGKELPRTSRMQYSGTTRISRSELRPGDLVFYHSPISHVAMYIGDGKVVEAANSRYNVRVRNDGLTRRGVVGFGRP